MGEEMNANEREIGAAILGEIGTWVPPRVVDYRTIQREFLNDLDRCVTGLLDEGWMLYGDPRYYPEDQYSGEKYAQTLVKLAAESGA